jgi:hypothetical protein
MQGSCWQGPCTGAALLAASPSTRPLTSQQLEAVLRQRVGSIRHLAQQCSDGAASTDSRSQHPRQLLHRHQEGEALE